MRSRITDHGPATVLLPIPPKGLARRSGLAPLAFALGSSSSMSAGANVRAGNMSDVPLLAIIAAVLVLPLRDCIAQAQTSTPMITLTSMVTITPTRTPTATPDRVCTTWQVGPSRIYKAPSEVATLVQDCDRVEVDAGTYLGDVAQWTANNLTLVGVGGRPILDAFGKSVNQTAIWLMSGNNNTVDNVEFQCETRIGPNVHCARNVGDENGCGIKLEGRGLTVRHCSFHDNDDGILGGSAGGNVLIENTEFFRNGDRSGQTHNVYIGHADQLTFRYNYSHDVLVGHLLKTRAYNNYILYNRLMDMTGTSSVEVDIPWGGLSYVIGNVLEKGMTEENAKFVTYNAEHGTNPGGYTQELYAINNTAVSDCGDTCGTGARGYFLYVWGAASVQTWNNLWVDGGALLTWGTTPGASDLSHNVSTTTPLLRDRAGFDYYLDTGSPAIDAGADPGTAHGYSLLPTSQYVYDAQSQLRPTDGRLDAGAFEYTGDETPIPTPTVGAPGCIGDCNGDGEVSVDELLTMVNIALGTADIASCVAGDANRDGTITIDEILAAVVNALNGCPQT
jgi:hypothetical protein